MDVCQVAKSFADNWLHRYVLVAEVLICVATLGLIVLAIALKVHRRVAVHVNTKIIHTSIIAICAVYTFTLGVGNVRFLIAYWTYKDPCDLPITVGFGLAVSLPWAVYIVGCPLFHVAATLERLRATLRADSYEKVTCTYGILASGTIFLLAAFYMVYLVNVILVDLDMDTKIAFYYVSTDRIRIITGLVNNTVVVLDLLTCIADIALIFVNSAKLKRVSKSYSLSHSYQLGENIRVTMRLVFPLGLCNGGLFIAYLGTAFILKSTVGPQMALAAYEAASLLTLLQAPLSLLIVLCFVKRAKRTVAVVDASEQQRLHFDQFRKQIESGQVQQGNGRQNANSKRAALTISTHA
ncbi:hypothetical protein AAVH_27819 [Aphelenchoides avenae]|nr:hypothetical protein AAVH_27819 [Aphelenchus avenae]